MTAGLNPRSLNAMLVRHESRSLSSRQVRLGIWQGQTEGTRVQGVVQRAGHWVRWGRIPRLPPSPNTLPDPAQSLIRNLAIILRVLCLTSLPLPLQAAPEFITRFQAASPVWPEGRELETNLTVGFHAAFLAPPTGRATLRLTGSTLYRCWLNGRFLAHGPARAGHNYFRVDELDLASGLIPGTNVIAIEVAGYNVNSYYLLNQPSFLQAEIVDGSTPLVATAAGHVFQARILGERLQKTQRYSFQRPFSEIWRLRPDSFDWRVQPEIPESQRCVLAVQTPRPLLPRRVPYPDYTERQPAARVAQGLMEPTTPPSAPWKDRSLTQIGPQLGGYPESQLDSIPSLEFQAWRNRSLVPESTAWAADLSTSLSEHAFMTADFGVNLTGFLGVDIEARRPSRVFLVFDEILREGDVDWKRLGCVNLVALELQPGRHLFESFEPYTLRYAKVVALEGDVVVHRLRLRELTNPDVYRAQFAASDPRLNRLFEAGRETYRQNATDIFMDCPSRERAGWLCDSYFTARTALCLSGNTVVEHNFLENFRIPAGFEFLPQGMLPMCYPADHNDGIFIPNWSLWFVVQLEEYLQRGGDQTLVESLRPRVMALLDFFGSLRNSDGLLEKLPSWVFIEWSKANEWTQDVNFPSNMLYARALEAAGRLYDQPNLIQRADQLRTVIRRLAYDGTFFADNAVRRNGSLQVTTNKSEVAQYFAFYFDVATPDSHPALWKTLRDEFGPKRRQTRAHPEVAPANAFVGNVLRLEILSRYGHCQQTLDESVDYQLYMADRTGTLWENDGDYASCNHGFASHVVHVLYRDVLGLHQIDPIQRRVRLRFTDVRLDWCEGSVPVEGGRVSLRWWTENGRHRYRVTAPAGYTVTVEQPPGANWERVD
ncbi:MAG: hypothetical protein IT581_23810 [Verrucomicrobiales bacterium]|nr:hypothetical protein [Verrucomicrobiales bacterium]